MAWVGRDFKDPPVQKKSASGIVYFRKHSVKYVRIK